MQRKRRFFSAILLAYFGIMIIGTGCDFNKETSSSMSESEQSVSQSSSIKEEEVSSSSFVDGTEELTIGMNYIVNGDRQSYSAMWNGPCNEKEINIPSIYNDLPVTSISDNAFSNCNAVENIIIPDSVIKIGDNAFYNCSNLLSIEMPNSVVTLGNSTFRDCTALEEVHISDNLTTIKDWTFFNCCNLKSVNIPNSVTLIGDLAFYGCNSLTSIKVDEDNIAYKSIDGNLYKKDGKTLIQYAIGQATKEFIIPSGVELIVREAFSGAINLTKVLIWDNVTSIEDEAFDYCENLTSVSIGERVAVIGEWVFSNCNNLANITVDENNATYKSIDGNVYSKDTKVFIQYAVGKKESIFTVPDGVTSIGSNAFWACNFLANIKLPDSITEIREYAFYGCSSLANITFEGTVKRWKEIDKGSYWKQNAPVKKVVCTDGTVAL
ncbi:MAG: leucine-rich repeat domain-containing protein [Clostridia bacterium]|nr:leucine-rich repeat domain-containing protein [Clostridia bacterium]